MAKVLIADDDDLLIELATFALRKAGHEVLAANDGEVALAAVAAERPDVIVLDRAMPELDGLQMLHELRRSAETAAIPVIILTATRRFEAEADLTQHVEAYMVKPFLPEELRACVEKAVRNST